MGTLTRGSIHGGKPVSQGMVDSIREDARHHEADAKKLREALGLLLSLPGAEEVRMDPNDPVGTAKKVVAAVQEENARLRGLVEAEVSDEPTYGPAEFKDTEG